MAYGSSGRTCSKGALSVMFFVIVVTCPATSRLVAANASSTDPVNCDRVRYTFEEKGLYLDTPKDMNAGTVMVCGEGPCCTQGMQQQLTHHSKRQFDTALTQTLQSLTSLLHNRAVKFDEFFKEMLAKSKREFHEMFKRTYGIIYEQNSYVFTDLFDELERYYAKGRVDLIEAMDNFFNTLYQKMFTVLNAQYNFNDKYLECVSEHMKELKPFGDVPNKLSVQLKRSFVATRTFGQALTLSASIVSSMQNIVMSSSCNRAVAKMTHCPACSGLNELKPCSNYCTNVMKGCLAYHSQLDSYWNAFIDALDKVVERLLGPFNIEMVVEPIDIKISEAIMNFQENSQQVSQRVFTGCGKPVLGRRKRSNGELSFETLQFSTNNGKSGKKQQQQAGGDGMDRVVKETRTRLKDTRQFWQKLPYHMCGTTVAEEKESCWNGEKKDKYSPAVVGDGMSNQQNNPEVDVDINRPNSLVNEQIFALKTITNKLKNAYNGMDVEWIDIEETYGSGSGSGGGPDDSDMEDNGSGMPGHPLEPEVEHPSTRNNEDNRLHPMGDSNGKVNYNFTTTDNSIGGGAASMTLNRALFSYLMPIVMMWFGNTVTEWLQ